MIFSTFHFCEEGNKVWPADKEYLWILHNPLFFPVEVAWHGKSSMNFREGMEHDFVTKNLNQEYLWQDLIFLFCTKGAFLPSRGDMTHKKDIISLCCEMDSDHFLGQEEGF